MQPILGRTWLQWIRLSRIFREPFARNRKKKWVDTISYLVFRGSSANLSPTHTFLERYLSRRHLKSMPVDLDYIKPFMGFCTTLIYVSILYMYQNMWTYAAFEDGDGNSQHMPTHTHTHTHILSLSLSLSCSSTISAPSRGVCEWRISSSSSVNWAASSTISFNMFQPWMNSVIATPSLQTWFSF